MSVDAMNWAGLCRVPGAGDRGRAVLDALAWWAADAGDPNAARAWPPVEIPEGHAACWRGITEIAERADAHPRTVRRILQRFESAGVILRQRRHRVDGQVVRRTSDVIYLNLARPPVHIERDAAQTERRREAALAARARRLAPLEPGARGHDAPFVGSARGHDAPFVAEPDSPTARGHLGGGPEDNVSGAPGGIVSGRSTDTHYDTGQDTPSLSLEPGTALGLGTAPVDEPPADGPDEADGLFADPADADRLDDVDQAAAAAAALGNRKDRRLPSGRAWQLLRRLHPAAFEGLIERMLADLVAAGDVDPDWHRGTPSQLSDVWRRVRAAALREVIAAAAPDRPPQPRHEEVA